MKLFVPFADDAEQERRVLASIRQSLSAELGAVFSDRCAYRLQYMHDGNAYIAEVGLPHPMNADPVIAILYEPRRRLYHVCTPNRGVGRGDSIMVGEHAVTHVELFEDQR